MKTIIFAIFVLSTYSGVLNAENLVRNVRQAGCQTNTCLNGGTCTPQGVFHTCACLKGFTGYNCELRVMDCGSFPCLNGGTCIPTQTPPQVGVYFYCQCQSGFYGDRCETGLSPCASNPCYNGACGLVVTGSLVTYTCTCSRGYQGTRCDVDINECSPNPCMYGGSCRQVSPPPSSGSLYICSCPSGYTGTDCQNPPDPCLSNPCFNGGTCQSAITSYTCVCVGLWAGNRCDVPIQPSSLCVPACTSGAICFLVSLSSPPTYQCGVPQCSPNPCQNGAACNIQGGIAQCQCRQGFTGTLCEKAGDTCFPGSSHVVLRGGSNLPMSRIKIGDEVLTQNDQDQIHFASVVAFLDYKSSAKVDYLRIGTVNNTAMSISPLHLIAVMRDGVKQFIHARRVQTGDELFVHREGAFSLERVSSIHERVDEGAFAPLTETGTVVVDGVVASCYAVVNSHEVGHWALTPLRWWGMMKNHFSVLPDESREGVHAFAGWLYSVAPGYLFS